MLRGQTQKKTRTLPSPEYFSQVTVTREFQPQPVAKKFAMLKSQGCFPNVSTDLGVKKSLATSVIAKEIAAEVVSNRCDCGDFSGIFRTHKIKAQHFWGNIGASFLRKKCSSKKDFMPKFALQTSHLIEV